MSKETYIYQRRPANVKRDLHILNNTQRVAACCSVLQRTASHIRDLMVSRSRPVMWVWVWCQISHNSVWSQISHSSNNMRVSMVPDIIEWCHAVGLWHEYEYGPRYLRTQLSHDWAWSPTSHNSNDMSMSMVPDTIVMSRSSPVIVVKECRHTPRSSQVETRNGHRNAKRNRNPETTILRLFSKFQMKRDLEHASHLWNDPYTRDMTHTCVWCTRVTARHCGDLMVSRNSPVIVVCHTLNDPYTHDMPHTCVWCTCVTARHCGGRLDGVTQ